MKNSLPAGRLREYSGRDSDMDHSDVSYYKQSINGNIVPANGFILGHRKERHSFLLIVFG